MLQSVKREEESVAEGWGHAIVGRGIEREEVYALGGLMQVMLPKVAIGRVKNRGIGGIAAAELVNGEGLIEDLKRSEQRDLQNLRHALDTYLLPYVIGVEQEKIYLAS